MAIIKNKVLRRFITIDNYPIDEDNRLSWKAKGLLTYLIGKPYDWTVRISDLVKRAKDGRDSVYSGLKELEECGYIKKVWARDESGSYTNLEYEVYDYPVTENPQDSTDNKPIYSENPFTEKPDTVKPDTVKPDLSNNKSTNNNLNNIKDLDDDLKAQKNKNEYPQKNERLIDGNKVTDDVANEIYDRIKDFLKREEFNRQLKLTKEHSTTNEFNHFIMSLRNLLIKKDAPKWTISLLKEDIE